MSLWNAFFGFLERFVRRRCERPCGVGVDRGDEERPSNDVSRASQRVLLLRVPLRQGSSEVRVTALGLDSVVGAMSATTDHPVHGHCLHQRDRELIEVDYALALLRGIPPGRRLCRPSVGKVVDDERTTQEDHHLSAAATHR